MESKNESIWKSETVIQILFVGAARWQLFSLRTVWEIKFTYTIASISGYSVIIVK